MSDTPFSFKKIAVAAFGPSLLFGAGKGAILPVIALSARSLDASVALASLIVGLIGIGSLFSNIPAAMIIARYGERLSMMAAAVVSVLGLLLCVIPGQIWMFALGVFLIGMAQSVFFLARQTYLIEAVPIHLRARAMSTLGGTMRIGIFVGPFLGAALMHFMGLPGAYVVAIAMMIGTGVLAYSIPDIEPTQYQKDKDCSAGKKEAALDNSAAPAGTVPNMGTNGTTTNGIASNSTTTNSTNAKPNAKPRMLSIARSHARVFLTLGVGGIMLVSALRAARQIILPLWADSLGLNPATISIIYGLVAAIDMSAFYPSGKAMDQRGRVWVAVPSVIIMGTSLILMPLTGSLLPFVLVSMLMGLGNGVGSGLVMTLGADASPAFGRTQFLGIWRLISDMGASGAPLLLSAVTAVLSLAAASVTAGLLGFVAAAVFWCHLPHTKPTRPR